MTRSIAPVSMSALAGLVFTACLAAPVAASSKVANAAIVPVQQSSPPRGPELRLPGMPPIQLPPGAKVFGPDGEQSGSGSTAPTQRGDGKSAADAQNSDSSTSGKKSAPVKSVKRPMSQKEVLTDLFKRLGKAKSRREARGIVASIERTWLNSGSDTADLLMQRALQAMKKKNHKLAIQLLDKVVYLEPRWAEVWNQRATARYYLDDPDGSVADIAQVLAHEPRHFGALVGLGFILRRAKQEEMALKVFRRALAINPQLSNIKGIIDKLKITVEGQGI